MVGESLEADNESRQLEDSVRRAHVSVNTEMRGQPIRNFTCRELPLGRLELFDISIDPIAIYRRTEDIDKDSNDDFLLATQLEGTVVVKSGMWSLPSIPVVFLLCPLVSPIASSIHRRVID